MSCQSRRVDWWINIYNFLKERCDGAKGVPQHRGKVRHRLALLAQLQQRILPCLRAGELIDPLVDLLTVNLSQRCWHRLGRIQENVSPNILPKSQPNSSHNLAAKQKSAQNSPVRGREELKLHLDALDMDPSLQLVLLFHLFETKVLLSGLAH